MATFSATNEKIEGMNWENQDIADVRDVNNQNRLLLRRFYEVLGAMGFVPGAPSAGGTVPAVRSIGGALVPGTVGTADVTVAPGVFLFVPSADPGQPDPNIFAHVVDSAVAVGTASDNLAGGDTRIDLLTVKVDRDILNAADQETRKGRTPANVIVQVTPHKRVRTRATFSYYEGTPGAGDPATPGDEVVIARYTMLDATSVFDSVENLLTATGWLPRSLPGSAALAQIKTDGEIEATLDPSVTTLTTSDSVTVTNNITLGGELRIRDVFASAFHVSLDAPAGMPANVDLTLPGSLPSIPGALSLDASGNIQADDKHGRIWLPVEPYIASAGSLQTLTTGQQKQDRIPVGNGRTLYRIRVRLNLSTADAEATLTVALLQDGADTGDITPTVAAVVSGVGNHTLTWEADTPVVVAIGEVPRSTLLHTGSAGNVVLYSMDMELARS